MDQHTESAEIDVPMWLVDSQPTLVTGDRAFVLSAPSVGWVEIGDPPPDALIWKHFDGDLRYTVVRVKGNGGLTEGGGGTWDDPELSVMCSEPASGDNPLQDGWVVAGLIPSKFETVRVRQGDAVMRQSPVHGHIVVPLNHAKGSEFQIYGQAPDDEEVLLYEFEPMPMPD